MTPEDVRVVSNTMHERPVTIAPGMTPEDVRAVSEKSVRQHETTRGRNAPFDCRRTQAAVPGAVTVPPHLDSAASPV